MQPQNVTPAVVPVELPIAQAQTTQAPVAKKKWETPRVITSTLPVKDTATGGNPGCDGTACGAATS